MKFRRWVLIGALLACGCGEPADGQVSIIPNKGLESMVSNSATFPGTAAGSGTGTDDARYYNRAVFADAVESCVAFVAHVPQGYDGGGAMAVRIQAIVEDSITFPAQVAWRAAALCVGEGENFHTIDIPVGEAPGAEQVCSDEDAPCLPVTIGITVPTCTGTEVGYPIVGRVCRAANLAADTADGATVNLYSVAVIP